MQRIRLFTAGFTRTSAEAFFTRLRESGVRRLIDVRLNNTSQLAGFAKQDDLKFFLREIVGADYVHMPVLAPTQDLLDAFKKHKGSWEAYESAFLSLMRERQIESAVSAELLDGACLLCSEDTPQHCHRRLVAEYLQARDKRIEIHHL
jgi:uncharacterized protein (DUF488 family)